MSHHIKQHMTSTVARPLVWGCALLVISICTVYWQIGNHEFVNFDDDLYVTANRYVQGGLTPENLKWAFGFTQKSYWHPLTWLSHMLDCQLFGLNSGMHHLTNLALHILNSIILFLVLARMTKEIWKSFVVAALFAVHPINVESVAWVAGRKNLLSTFFWVLTILSYARYAEHQTLARYTLVLVVFACGLLAKPMLVTLPFVLLLLDYWPLERLADERLSANGIKDIKSHTFFGFECSTVFRLTIEKVPFFVLSALAIHISSAAIQGHGIAASTQAVPMGLRFANAIVSYVKYIGKMIWPSNLAVFYPFPEVVPAWQLIGALGVIIGITLVAGRLLKRAPYLAVGWLWYMGTLLPVIGLVQAGLWPAMADRWAYVPFIGMFIMVAWGVPDIFPRRRYRKIILKIISVAIILIPVVIASLQVRYWENSISLLEHTLDISGSSAFVHNNLGNVYTQDEKLNAAIRHYQTAIKLSPGFARTHNNLGVALKKKGRLPSAISHFQEAVRLNPEYAEPHFSLGVIFGKLGRKDEAIAHYYAAVRIDPEFADAFTNLGIALIYEGKVEAAIFCLQEAARLKPDSQITQNNLRHALSLR
jgi:tetratricopeptide (TPR) repeat protein